MAAQSNSLASAEGFRMLEDLICDAIPGPELPAMPTLGRGANGGMEVVSESVIRTSHPALSEERIAGLRALTNLHLLAYLRNSASELSPQELGAIHDIAIERLTQNDEPFPERAAELSREAMVVILNRIV